MTLALALLFVASALLRTVCALSFGERSIFYDELLHWKTGQSLAQTGKIALRGLNLSYSEVLYSVVIALCNLLFSDGQAAYTAALVANCILISAAIFPIYIMARRIIGERKKWRFSLCAVISCLAELSVSMRIFQESLYFPLLMGFFCLFTLLVTGEKPPTVPKMVGLSAYTLLVTSCKQMGLGMVAGMACYFVYVLVTERERRRQNLMNAVAYLGSFIAFWLSYNRIYFLLNQSRGATSSAGASPSSFKSISTFCLSAGLCHGPLLPGGDHPADGHFCGAAPLGDVAPAAPPGKEAAHPDGGSHPGHGGDALLYRGPQ